MNNADEPVKEVFQPLPNVARENFKGFILFYLRLFFDIGSFTVYKDVKRYLARTNKNVLEVGCGFKPYRYLVPAGVKYCGVDWIGAGNNFHCQAEDVIYYAGDILPLEDSSFDYLFHTEVLEHVYYLDQFLNECYRVLSENGKMFFTIPFAARNHYIPYDYWRLTPVSLEKLLVKAGFTHILVRPRGADIIVIIAKINVFFVRIIMRAMNNSVLSLINKVIFGSLFIIPIIFNTLLGHILLFLRVGSVDDPLGYSVYCDKIGEYV